MNNELENIIKAAQTVKLSENEKAVMKSNVFLSMNYSSFANVTNSKPSRLYYMSEIGNYLNLLIKQNNYMTALILAIMLAVSGGTSAVAENAIPGDALYAIKTSINEPVAGLFAVGKESNATWQERLVERRLEEVQKVVAQGTLSTSTKAEIEKNINSQIDKFTLAAKNLSEDKDKAVSSSELEVRLESALQAHQNILARATTTKETTKELISSLKDDESKVKGDREKMELTLGDNANASSTQVSALNKQAVAEKILGNVKTKYQEEKVNLSTSTISTIDGKLAQAEKILTDGKADVTSGKYDLAREKFQEVIKLANNTRVDVLTNSIKSNIEDDMKIKHDDEGRGDDNNGNRESERNSTSTIRKNDNEKRSSTSTNSTSTIRKSDEGKSDGDKVSKRVEVESGE